VDLNDSTFAGGMLGVRDYCTDGNQSLSTFSNLVAMEVGFSSSSRPVLTFPLLTNGCFQMTVTGAPGVAYSIYASTNLALPGWSLLLTTNPPVLPFSFVDPAAANSGQRFYRVLAAQ
jgi:hypothetical protein